MSPRLSPATKALLIVTVAVFGLQHLLGGALAGLELWPLQSPYTQRFMPWQLLSYGFLHGDFAHLFFNMLVLFMFGTPLEQVWGRKRFVLYYLVCIIGAGLCQLAVGVWTVQQGGTAYPVLGASGGVLGLVLGYGMVFPNQKVMVFPIPFLIPAKVVAVLVGLFALFAGVTGSVKGVAHFAHIGGMVTGWLLIRAWRGQPPFGGGKRKKPHLRSL